MLRGDEWELRSYARSSPTLLAIPSQLNWEMKRDSQLWHWTTHQHGKATQADDESVNRIFNATSPKKNQQQNCNRAKWKVGWLRFQLTRASELIRCCIYTEFFFRVLLWSEQGVYDFSWSRGRMDTKSECEDRCKKKMFIYDQRKARNKKCERKTVDFLPVLLSCVNRVEMRSLLRI